MTDQENAGSTDALLNDAQAVTDGGLIFDLDGTLVDSCRDLIPALNHATARFDLPPVQFSDVGHIVGHGTLAMVRRAFAHHARPLGAMQEKAMIAEMLAYYEAHIADYTIFFDNCLDALDELSAQGWKIGVCTNKLEKLAEKLLHDIGERDRFSVVTGGDTFPVKKPDPEHVKQTAALMGIDPRHCIMIGDSINDIKAGQLAGMVTIGVTFGYTDIPMKQLKPDELVSDFGELPKVVRKLAREREIGHR